MNQHIKTYPPVTVAYFRNVGPYGVSMKAVWDQLNQWAKGRSIGSPGGVMYGISHDSPMDTPPDKCRYDACVEVPSNFEVDGGAQRAELPGGDYAVLAFRGVPTDIIKGLDRVFHQIIPELGKQFDFTRPVFERYTGDCRVEADDSFGCDLCVPVK